MIIETSFTSAASLQLLQLESQDCCGLAEGKIFGDVKHEVLAVTAWFHPGVQALSTADLGASSQRSAGLSVG